jgi:hypothetical protein
LASIGNLGLTDLAGNRLAVTGAAGVVPLDAGDIEGIIGRPDALGLPVGSGRRLIGSDYAGHAQAIGERRPE